MSDTYDEPIELNFGGYWRYKDVPPGSLFLDKHGSIVMVSEYTTNERAIQGLPHESYIVGSGEFYHGDKDDWVVLLEVGTIYIEFDPPPAKLPVKEIKPNESPFPKPIEGRVEDLAIRYDFVHPIRPPSEHTEISSTEDNPDAGVTEGGDAG